jgi:polyprenyl-phospho-N-acetylgalactosaminyl synthase
MICVVIPAYNEERRVKQVIDELSGLDMKILVVNDGSSDDTDKVLRGLNVINVNHATNLGQGAALRTGTEIAKRLGATIIAHYDADGQFQKDDLVKLVNELNSKDHDIVLGSRYLETKSKVPIKKRIILYLAKLFSKHILQLNFTDPQNGLRVFRSDILEKMNWQKDGFEHCSEILGLIKKNNLRYKELPITVNYDNYSTSKKDGPSAKMGVKMVFSKLFD